MHNKRIHLNIILFLLSFCCSVLFLEVLFRVFPVNNNLYYKKLEWNPEMVGLYNELYVYDEVLGYEKKDIYERIKNVLKNNSKNYKILVLGDSITQWGKYVDYFDNLLAERYNKEIKVINAGVMGYDTELEYRYLKYKGLDLNPNLVILQFCMNDFRGTPLIIKQKDGSWFALNGGRKLDRWFNPKLIARSALYEFIALRLLYFSSWKKNKKDVVRIPLQKIKHLLEERRIPFYVVVFPWLGEQQCYYDDYRTIGNILNELNLSLYTIDLLPYYSRASFDKIREDLIHPNEEGNKIAANVLLDELKPFLDREFNIR